MASLKYRDSNEDYQGFHVKVTDTLPIGAIYLWGGITAPSGYLICDGRAVSRTEYADLFKAIGTYYGSGDGLTTFNLPDHRGRVTVGLDVSDVDFNTIGKTGGEKTHTLTVDEIPSHNHEGLYWENVNQHVGLNDGQNTALELTWNLGGSRDDFKTGYTGGGQAHNNLQPYTVRNYIIKASNKVALERGNVVDSLTGEDTDSAPSVRAVKSAILDVEDITSKITKTSNVGAIYSINAYKKGSRCYLNTIFDLNAVGNVFTIDNSLLPKYGEIATGTNYDEGSTSTCTARIVANNANISVDVYDTKKDYAAMHIEWEV